MLFSGGQKGVQSYKLHEGAYALHESVAAHISVWYITHIYCTYIWVWLLLPPLQLPNLNVICILACTYVIWYISQNMHK